MKRLRNKACERCAVISDVLFRIQSDSSGVWRLWCPECRRTAANHPDYRYGGTWKAIKRH